MNTKKQNSIIQTLKNIKKLCRYFNIKLYTMAEIIK